MSPQDKAPAYFWYVRDFMSDEAVALMSYEQQGIYRALLDRQWLEGSIPADPSEIAAILRIPFSRFDKLWPRVAVKFRPVADGRLANERMERERKKADEFREKSSNNGRKGAEARWQGHSPANGPAIVSPLAKNGSSFASASAPASAVKTSRRSASASVTAPGFFEFWIAYPKHKGRKDAEKAWSKLAPDAELQRQILSALSWQRVTPDWTKDGGQFVPFPATYLNNRRWEDEPPSASSARLSDVGKQSLVGLSAFRERMAAKAAGGEQ